MPLIIVIGVTVLCDAVFCFYLILFELIFLRACVDTEYLDDVVVIAYGTQSARTVTASVSSVKSDALKDAPNMSFDSMLQGQVV